MTRRARWRVLAAIAAALLLAPAHRAVQAQGTVTGRVATEANLPLGGVRILAIGANQSATSGDDGRYTLRNVRAGVIEIQALQVGRKSQKNTVTVPNGGSVESNFQMPIAVIQLTEIVTTATGQQRKIELGNAISTLGDVTKRVEESSISSMADLLVAKSPGVIVLPSPVIGGAPNIRVRGISSISLSNAPIWYVDGVRYNTTTAASSAGSTPISVLNNLSPEEIEDIEIVKGPSAATLYGTNAANGVILVTTKKGRPGATKWTYTGETRTVSDRNHYQEQYANFGHSLSTGKVTRCQLAVMQTAKFTAAQGATCTGFNTLSGSTNLPGDSLTNYDYLSDPEATFIHLGRGSLFGANVSGGNEAVRFFANGDLDNEFGPIQMAQRDINFYQDSLKTPVLNSMFHPRQQQKLNFRTNLAATTSPTLDLNVNAGFGKTTNIIEPDNAQIIALLYLGQSGFGYKGCPKGTETTGCGLDKPSRDNTGFPLFDANSFNPGSVMQFYTPVDVQRFTGSMQANWRPLSWLQNDGTVGVDLFTQDVVHICKLNECPASGATSRVGNVSNTKNNRRNFSGKLASSAAWQARPWANLRTTIGADYTNEERDALAASGRGLAIGASTLASSSTFVSYSSTQATAVKTLGYYAQEQLSLRDRLFLTVAARQDQNSAFGTNFQHITYPKVSVSWIMSDEQFFPKFSWLSSFRLRSAYGANGVQPGATDALQTFTPQTASIALKEGTAGTDVPGLVANQPGNSALKPETSTELESGFDTDWFNRRIHLEYTYYNKKTTDALIAVPIPLSVAAPVTSLQQNLGSTKNSGHEIQLSAQVFESRRVNWDMTVSYSRNSNEWVTLGADPTTGKDRVLGGGGTTQQRAGYPLNAQWYRNFTFADANGDGIIQRSEVKVDDTLSFQGVGFAKTLASVQSGFDLFNRKLRINMLFDHKGGGRTMEGNYFQCSSTPYACRETQDATSPLELQARAVAYRYGTSIKGTTYTTRVGYFSPFDFWKFRELSAVLALPDRISRSLRAQNGSTFMIGARNLRTWTSFSGVDPEQNYGLNAAEVQSDFNTSPTPSYLVLRLNLKY